MSEPQLPGSGSSPAPRRSALPIGGATAWRPEHDLLSEQPDPAQAPRRALSTPEQGPPQPPFPAQPLGYSQAAYHDPHASQQYAAAAPLPGQAFPTQPPPGPSWITTAQNLAVVTALPVEERSYPAFYRTPRWRWWKPLLALIVAGFASLVAMGLFPLLGMIADGTDVMAMAQSGKLELGPWGFLGNNVGIALCIPIAFFTQWLFFGQRPKWLSSVVGGFRWGWFGRCVAIILPLWVVVMTVEILLGGLPEDIRIRPYTVLMIVGIALTTPFQAAGEEYLMRGLQTRLIASYFRSETVGWVIATILSSLTFMLLHGAGDVWLNVFYLTFGVVASWIVWKTGGLEAAVAIHVVNNVISEIFMPFTDFSSMFERGAGAGDPSVLIHMAILLIAALLLWRVAKKRNVVVRSAPGRVEVERAQASAASSWQGWQAPTMGAQPPVVPGQQGQ